MKSAPVATTGKLRKRVFKADDRLKAYWDWGAWNVERVEME